MLPTQAIYKPVSKKHQYTSLIFLFASILIVSWLSLSGAIQLYTGSVYDTLIRFSPLPETSSADILLIELDSRNEESEKLTQLVHELNAFNAKKIAFTYLPEQLSQEFLQAVADSRSVVFARKAIRNPETGEFIELQAWPESLAAIGAIDSIMVMPPNELGVSRRQLTHVNIAGEQFPVLVTDLSGLEAPDPNNQGFRVNFLSGENRIPIVSLKRALSGGLIKSLVSGRTVIIGHARDVKEPGLHTPSSGPIHTISLLQFTGLALDSLLQKTTISQMPTMAQLLLLLMLTLLSVYLYQQISVRAAAWLTVGIPILYLLIAWATLAYLYIWLPVVEIILLQYLSFFTVFVRKATREEQLIRRTLIETTARLRDRVIPASFYATEEPWLYVANLLNQTLDLERLIFLEKVPDDHRVKEVYSLRCKLEDINELRRDYHRTPYSTAIAAAAPIRLELDYLKPLGGADIQYLIPLVFADDIIGFWAFSTDEKKRHNEEKFVQLVTDYAEQIAEMLYHRQRWLAEQASDSNAFVRYLRMEGWEDTHRSMNQALALLDRRLLGLERVFDGISTAAILYDLFGRVMQVNQQMEQLMKKVGLAFFGMTAVDMVKAITGRDESDTRNYLYYVVMERSVISLPAPLIDDEHNTYLLTIRPLVQKNGQLGLSIDGAEMPFHLGGILIELMDISVFKTLNELQTNVVDRLKIRLRSDLEALLLATELLQDEDNQAEDIGMITEILDEKVESIVTGFDEVQKYLHFTTEDASLERYPVDALAPINRCIEELTLIAKKKSITFTTDLPEMMCLVIAAPKQFAEILNTILTVLIQDAGANSSIKIRLMYSGDFVHYHLHNNGFGLPPERLHEYLHGERDITADDFSKLRIASDQIKAWGGTFEASTDLGKGITFEIKLRGFI